MLSLVSIRFWNKSVVLFSRMATGIIDMIRIAVTLVVGFHVEPCLLILIRQFEVWVQ